MNLLGIFSDNEIGPIATNIGNGRPISCHEPMVPANILFFFLFRPKNTLLE